jgi:biopolymer transport protein ExbB
MSSRVTWHRIALACLLLLGLAAQPALAQQEGAGPPAAPAAAAPDTAAPATAAPAAAPAAPAPSAPASVAHAALPQDLSPWGMVVHANLVVQLVMAGLVFASVLTWTIALAKGLELLGAYRRTKLGLMQLHDAADLDQALQRIGDKHGTCAALLRAATAELDASGDASHKDGVKERVAWKLERIIVRASRKLSSGTGLLATIGATAPFVGLFGTVWGIMDSFIGISRAQTTNLAVVAPGIAEALLATAIGLVTAIPAVVIYNAFARAIAAHKAHLADGVSDTMRLLSRDLDRGGRQRFRLVAE